MQLSNIAQFLEIYKKKLALEDDKRNVLKEIISKEIGIKIDEKLMVITNGILIIKSTPVVKNEIFLHKTKLLKKIQDDSNVNIHDIQ